MINLDQVRTLEWKVKQAVQLIVHLRRENDTLRGRLSDTEVRLQEMESLLEAFKATQNEMESGIRSALEELDHLEASPQVSQTSGPVDPLSYPPVEAVAPSPEVASAFAAEDPAELFEKSPAPAVFAEEPVDSDPSFDEEYAALVEAEASAVAEAPVDESVPVSVELEDDLSSSEEEVAYAESTPVTEEVKDEDRSPEQPGLGIF